MTASGDTDNGLQLDQSPAHRSLLIYLHDTDVDAESSEIFPKRICQTCTDLFKGGVEVIVRNTNLVQRNIPLFDLVSCRAIIGRIFRHILLCYYVSPATI